MTKVVYNASFGGFGLSDKAVAWLKNNGVPDARGHSFADGPRHDARLVACVEALGDDTSARFASLRIHECTGNKYRITEYDGLEDVEEPETIKGWVEVES